MITSWKAVLAEALLGKTGLLFRCVSQNAGEAEQFPPEFDQEIPVGESGNGAFFGRNVLRGLVDGIDDFVQTRQDRWKRRSRVMGSVLLGSAMWIDDPELIDRLAGLSGACIVVTKQDRDPRKVMKLDQLEEVNDRAPGIPTRAFPGLGGLAPKVDGRPTLVGPYDQMDEDVVPTIRTLGYRRQGRELVPLIHAKLALLGRFWWHDEGPLGHVEDIIGFTPYRLWISSANFTASSRRSLEFGYWTEDPALLEGAERFLVRAIRSSENLNPEADSLDPEYVPVEFDDEAMAEAAAEILWGEDDL